LEPHHLTYAAELAGGIRTAAARDALVALLTHPIGYVREGAVYGLAQRIDDPTVVAALRVVLNTDDDPGVCEAARDALGS